MPVKEQPAEFGHLSMKPKRTEGKSLSRPLTWETKPRSKTVWEADLWIMFADLLESFTGFIA